MRKFGIVLGPKGEERAYVLWANDEMSLRSRLSPDVLSVEDLGEVVEPAPKRRRSRLAEWYRALVSADH